MLNPLLVLTLLFSPLASSLAILLFARRSKNLSFFFSILGIVTSFVCTLILANEILLKHQGPWEVSYPWVQISQLTIPFGFLINPLAVMMLLVVTGIGSLIFLYSRQYMLEDESFPRFFAFLSLFAFSMIGIVVSNNLIQLFIFWELVGVSSYLLIGFWFNKASAANAGVKAFIANRVADFGFLCGIFLLWSVSDIGQGRSFEITTLAQNLPQIQTTLWPIIAFLLFCGVIGKSAQMPLHVWLADAMEGPTPVSALIHAATMVAAGIYLLARTFFVFEQAPQTLSIIAIVGGVTAFLAATMAVVENDIKRILAYSTLSQLGLMVMAVGLGGPSQGMFHLTTHAFFKALLFLGAGSVIYALHHEQDIWNMKGLFKQMPITGFTFLVGVLALSGIPPLSGFFSKDEIISLAFHHHNILFGLALATSFLTAFYMGRLFFVAFLGEADKHHPAHESPAIMTLPLIILAFFAIFGGFMNIPHLTYPQLEAEPLNWTVAGISTLAGILGLSLAAVIYLRRPKVDPLTQSLGPLYPLLKNKYYFDEVYAFYINQIQQPFAMILQRLERTIIVRLGVHGLTALSNGIGFVLRQCHNGIVQWYAAVYILGTLILLLIFLKILV